MSSTALPIAIIADDLTGALDTAAPFATHGRETWLALRPDSLAGLLQSGAEIIAITTDTRHALPVDAARRVESAIEPLTQFKPTIVFKKIDSLLRGNVAVEIAAALQASGRGHAVIAPAVPAQNRLLRNGIVYFSKHGAHLPSSEMTEGAHVPSLLARAFSTLNIHTCAAGERPMLSDRAGLHAYVVDAETNENLDELARFIVQHPGDNLPVGASGLGRALARALRPSAGATVSAGALQRTAGPLLFVIGSRTAIAAEQTSALLQAGAEQIIVPIAASKSEDDLIERQLAVLRTSARVVLRPDSTSQGSDNLQVAANLGRAAAAAVRLLRPSALIMSGGDTASACLNALKIPALRIMGALHDGIAMGTITSERRTIRVFTKSGSFGTPRTWVRLAEQILNDSAAC